MGERYAFSRFEMRQKTKCELPWDSLFFTSKLNAYFWNGRENTQLRHFIDRHFAKHIQQQYQYHLIVVERVTLNEILTFMNITFTLTITFRSSGSDCDNEITLHNSNKKWLHYSYWKLSTESFIRTATQTHYLTARRQLTTVIYCFAKLIVCSKSESRKKKVGSVRSWIHLAIMIWILDLNSQ